MNKLLTILIMIVFLTVPSMVSAHTELFSSSPKEGEVVKVEIHEIRLEFEGDLEELSSMKILKNGEEIPFSQVQVFDQQMVGTLLNSLDNGTYVIQWNIAGEDGHPISGEFPFSVQMEEKKVEKTEAKEPVTTVQEDNKETNKDSEEINTKSSNMLKNIIPFVFIVILVIGLFFLFRKKR